jgi:hypothetical protein
MSKDISRYYPEIVENSTKEGYTKKQLETALAEFGYDEVPENGINDEGYRRLMKRVAEIDYAESRLTKVKKKDLSSKVLEVQETVKKEKETNNYSSIIGKDLKKVGKKIGNAMKGTGEIMLGWAMVPTGIRLGTAESETGVQCGIIIMTIGSILGLCFDPKKVGIGLAVYGGTNLLSGLYEYARSIKKRAGE